jgi:hypothetical protein
MFVFVSKVESGGVRITFQHLPSSDVVPALVERGHQPTVGLCHIHATPHDSYNRHGSYLELVLLGILPPSDSDCRCLQGLVEQNIHAPIPVLPAQ